MRKIKIETDWQTDDDGLSTVYTKALIDTKSTVPLMYLGVVYQGGDIACISFMWGDSTDGMARRKNYVCDDLNRGKWQPQDADRISPLNPEYKKHFDALAKKIPDLRCGLDKYTSLPGKH